MTFNPIAEDAPLIDSDHPPINTVPPLMSGGQRLLGVMYLANGRGPHPTVMLLHGFPGFERNFDLAHTLRRAGYNVLVFHYRGAWGTPGDFRYTHVLEDAANVLAWLRSDEARENYRVDSAHIIPIGHSMGGFTALMTAAADSSLRAVGGLAAWQVGVDAQFLRDGVVPPVIADFPVNLLPLNTTGDALKAEMDAHLEHFTINNHAEKLADKHILLIGAAHDEEVDFQKHHVDLVAALQAANAQHLTDVVLHTNHGFTGHRITLMRTILDWLAEVTA